jgi:hypothetical protein
MKKRGIGRTERIQARIELPDNEQEHKTVLRLISFALRHVMLSGFDEGLAKDAKKLGYQRLEITGKDIDTGKQVLNIPVYLKPNEIEHLKRDIKKFAFPRELLDQGKLTICGECRQAGAVTLDTTMYKLINKQILGSPPRDKDYDEIAALIRAEGTKAAYKRERETLAKKRRADEQVPKAFNAAFGKAMRERGIYYRRLK